MIGVTVLAAACGGGGKDVSSTPATTAARVPVTPPSAPATTSPGATATSAAGSPATTNGHANASSPSSKELPRFMSDFSRVCTTQVGFGGATPYDSSAAVHPVAVFENDGEDGSYFQSIPTLPAGWTITPDPNANDNSALAAVQLVACVHRTATVATGVQCNFDNDGKTVTLGLADASYDVTIYAATTGQKLGATAVDAKTSDCPYVAVFREGETQYVSSLTDDDLTNAVKPYVMPA
jgi:hypothetical protein